MLGQAYSAKREGGTQPGQIFGGSYGRFPFLSFLRNRIMNRGRTPLPQLGGGGQQPRPGNAPLPQLDPSRPRPELTFDGPQVSSPMGPGGGMWAGGSPGFDFRGGSPGLPHREGMPEQVGSPGVEQGGAFGGGITTGLSKDVLQEIQQGLQGPTSSPETMPIGLPAASSPIQAPTTEQQPILMEQPRPVRPQQRPPSGYFRAGMIAPPAGFRRNRAF